MQNNSSLYAQASAAAARKDKLTAKKLLDVLIFNEPGNEQAWLLLVEMVDDINEESDCLQHALALNPLDPAAQQKYDELLHRHPKLAELDPAKAGDYAKVKAAKKAEAKAAKKAKAAEKAQEAKAARKKA
jgi:hypothetical protein